MSPTSYQTAPPRDNNTISIKQCLRILIQFITDCPFLFLQIQRSECVGTTRSLFDEVTLVAPPRDNINLVKVNMAEEEGFEPPRALTPLSVFKTDPFSRTWVFLRIFIIMVDLVGLEPTTGRL